MSFWSDLASSDNSKVHTPQVFLLAIGILLMLLALILIIYHCFWHGKGIDAETVKLILGLLGGGVLNAGASYFNKTTVSNITAMGGMPTPDGTPPPRAKPAPPQE